MKRLPFSISSRFNRGGMVIGLLALAVVTGGFLLINFPIEVTIGALFVGSIFLMERG